MSPILQSFVSSPAAGWMLLVVLGVEAIVLIGLWRRNHIGLPPFEVTSFLGAGACFSIALLAVLSDWPEEVIAIALSGAFVLHVIDLKGRWRS